MGRLWAMDTIPGHQRVKQRRLKSARLVGESESFNPYSKLRLTSCDRYEKPWIAKSPYKARERWDKVILWGGITAGFLIGVPLCYFAYENIPRHQVSRCFASLP
jgi:hypothetical protein